MVYADYNYYSTVFLGVMDKDGFDRLAVQASGYIDAVTFGRASALPDGDARLERVKLCCCALADLMLSCENGGEITSERNDGWEITHSVYSERAVTPAEKLRSTALLWLGGTGLMSCGAASFIPT